MGQEEEIDVNTKIGDVLPMATQLFFPDGLSQHGKVDEFIHLLQLFDGTSIDNNKTINDIYKEKAVKILRMYLCSYPVKKEVSLNSEQDQESLNTNTNLETKCDTDEVEAVDMELNLDDIFYFSTPINTSINETVTFERSSCHSLSDTISLQKLDITVHRGHVLQDLISFFKHYENSSKCMRGAIVHVTMILPNGDKEAGEDNGGIFRDMISECFNDFYDTLTSGNLLKVPALQPKMGQEDWQALGSIIELAYCQEKMLPIQLSPSFMNSAMTGEDIDKMTIVDEYIKYLPISEAELVKRAVENYEEVDQDEVIDFINDHHHTAFPHSGDSFKKMVGDIAHKELIQEPEYIAKQWRSKLRSIQSLLPNNRFEFESLIPTFKKVWSSIVFEDTVLEPQKRMLRRFLKEIGGMLGNFLRFCTGNL